MRLWVLIAGAAVQHPGRDWGTRGTWSTSPLWHCRCSMRTGSGWSGKKTTILSEQHPAGHHSLTPTTGSILRNIGISDNISTTINFVTVFFRIRHLFHDDFKVGFFPSSSILEFLNKNGFFISICSSLSNCWQVHNYLRQSLLTHIDSIQNHLIQKWGLENSMNAFNNKNVSSIQNENLQIYILW